MKGVIFALSSVITGLFHDKISASLNDLFYNINVFSEKSKKQMQELKDLASRLQIDNVLGSNPEQNSKLADLLQQQKNVYDEISKKVEQLSEFDQKRILSLTDQGNELSRQALILQHQAEIEQQNASAAVQQLYGRYRVQSTTNPNVYTINPNIIKTVEKLQRINELYYKISSYDIGGTISKSLNASLFEQLEIQISSIGNQFKTNNDLIKAFGRQGAEAFIQLRDSVNKGVIPFETLEQVLGQLQVQGDITENVLARVLQTFGGVSAQQATQDARGLGNAMEQAGDAAVAAEQGYRGAGNIIQLAGKIADKAKPKILTLGEAVTTSVQALSNLGMSLTSIKGVIDTLNNEDLSFFDKFTTIATQSGFLMANFSNLKKNGRALIGDIANKLDKLKEQNDGYNQVDSESVVEAIKNNFQGDELFGEEATNAFMQLGAFEQGKINAEELEKTLKSIGVDNEKILSSIKDGVPVVEILGDILKNKIETTLKGLPAILDKIIASAGPILGGAFAIALVNAIQKGLYNQSYEGRIEGAETAIENLNSSVTELKDNLSGVTSAFDNYKSLIDALNECDRGTEEWNNALKNVKDSMWDLLDAYPELLKLENLYNEDGLLNGDAVKDYVKGQENKITQGKVAALSTEEYKEQLTLENNRKKILNRTGGMVEGETLDSIISALANKEGQFDDIVKSLNLSEIEKQLLEKNRDQIEQLAEDTRTSETTTKNRRHLMAQELLGENASSKLVNDYSKAYELVMNSEENQDVIANARYLATLSGHSYDSHLKEINEQGQKYLDAKGYDWEFLGTDSNGQYIFKDATGEIQKVLAEELGAAIVAANANGDIVTELRKQWAETLGNGLINNLNEDIDVSILADMMTALEDSGTKFEYDLVDFLGKTTEEQEALLKAILETATSTSESRAATIISDAAEKYDLDAEVLEAQARALADVYELDAEAAAELAVQNQRMQAGYEDLVDNWDDWKKSLVSSKKGTKEQAQAIVSLTKTVANLVGASEDLELPDEFFEEGSENLQLLEQAAKGSKQAIELLGVEVGKAQIQDLEMLENFDFGKIYDSAATDDQLYQGNLILFNNYKDTVLEGLNTLSDSIKANAVEVGDSLSDIFGNDELASDWVNKLNDLALATGMTVDEMNSLLGSVGMKANVKITEKKMKIRKPVYRTVTREVRNNKTKDNGMEVWDGGPVDTLTYSYVDHYTDIEEMVQIPQIATEPNDPGSPNIQYVGNGNLSNTGDNKGGGSGGSTSKVSTKKSDVLDRYKEQDDALDDISDALDRVSKSADRAFGANRLKQLRSERDLYVQQKEALEDKLAVADQYYELDKKALTDKASSYGVNFTFDDMGNITNYTSEMTKLYNELHAAEEKYNAMTSKDAQEAFKEATLQPIEDKISELRELISQFEDTRELREDLEKQIQEAFEAWQDENYEILQYELELKIDIDDAKLKKLEFLLTQYGDNFYKMAEAAVAMMDKTPVMSDALTHYYDHWQSLESAYANNEISQADYIDGLKESRDGMYEQLEALIDLDNEMMHYYEDTLSAATAELDDFTDHLEHLTSVFDHYMSLMEILGREKDYGAMGDFLSGKADVLRDRLNVAQQYYQELAKQRDLAEQALANTTDEHERELLQENLDAIIDEVDAAEDDMLSLTEEWAEAMKAVIQNNMDEIASILEDALTGGLGFETLMDNFDKLNTRQEEYLTKTNQIYETNKLMRTANKALDETDNKVAKQKLKNFIEETKSLQENTKLSNYELEIQQAKYDLLLAEIALEEAQNAKSTVRLSRDSEGNYGYVYTADQDAVDDAQQAVEDAENRLYNLSLEGQQEYTDKYLQAQQEMYEELADLSDAYLNGELADDEEFYARREEILNHYLGPDGILSTYQYLYNVAVRTDADATADYWAKDYGAMTQNTLEWHDAVTEYINSIDDQTKEWKQVSEQANKDVQNALEDTEKATKDLTDESADLANQLQSKVIPAISAEIEAVRRQTEAYAAQRSELMNLIETYKSYIDAINSTIEYESNNLTDSSTSSTSGISDYSYAMTVAYKQGDWAKVNDLADQRDEAIKSGKKTSVDTDDIIKIFKAADKGDQDAIDFINGVYAHDGTQYVDSQVDPLLKKIAQMSTGGYTGEWGPEGKLAVLHDKELVLNRNDTENLLSTIGFVRELVNVIDSQSALSRFFNLSSVGVGDNNQTIEQKVEITASFPNATNHSEIEEAFNGLINKASQYANRKR